MWGLIALTGVFPRVQETMTMSEPPETEFDLERLFLPAWAQESPATNKYAGFAGEDRRESRFDDRPGRRGPPRGGGRPGEQRPRGGGLPQRGREGGNRGGPRDGRHEPAHRPEHREAAPPPLPQLTATILPDDKGLDSMARQIRMTGRAYPLFDIAQLILDKPERQQVRWEVIKDAAGKAVQPLYLCALDDSLWLSEDEAVTHLLGKNFTMFYQAEKTATEPPRGTYTFVAQCGMSGTILGPPNYHDYQNKLRKLHSERFARMPFEAFKARVKIVKDEAVVKKWIEDQSTKTEYICLNVPEALKLGSREAVEKHFRETHLPNLIKAVEGHTMSGPAGAPIALARPATPVAQRLGGATALSLEAGHHLEPAVRQPRPAVFQGQPHGHACLGGPPALSGHGGHAGLAGSAANCGISSTRRPNARGGN